MSLGLGATGRWCRGFGPFARRMFAGAGIEGHIGRTEAACGVCAGAHHLLVDAEACPVYFEGYRKWLPCRLVRRLTCVNDWL